MMNKRAFMMAAGAGSAAAAMGLMSPVASATGTVAKKRRTYVLIHGAWHGGWCWKYVAESLRKNGHRVYTPSLTGLAEHSHLLSSAITLTTHITDVVNLFRWEDIEDAVLVAHSYGGWPVSGALEQIGDRVRSVVFVDAFRPENGQRVMDTNSAQFQQALKAALARGEAGRPVPDAGIFGILKPENRAWVQSKMTPQPAGVAVEPIKLTGAVEHVASKTYVRATGYSQPHFDRYFANAKADPTWRAIGMDPKESGHDVMIDAPDKLANILEHV